MCPKSILAPAIGLNGGRDIVTLYGLRYPLVAYPKVDGIRLYQVIVNGGAIMTMVESLPRYAEAEALAESRGTNLIALIEAYIDGYIASHEPWYASDAVLDGETVCHTAEESAAHLDAIINGAAG